MIQTAPLPRSSRLTLKRPAAFVRLVWLSPAVNRLSWRVYTIMKRMPKANFFISRTGADSQWAEWIAQELEAAGYTTFLQDWDFSARPEFHSLANMRLGAECECTIAVLSPEYLRAEFTQSEWESAMVRDPRAEGRQLIPVRVRRCEIPPFLLRYIYIDLVDRDVDAARDALIKGVKGEGLKRKAVFPGDGAAAGRVPFPDAKEVPFEACTSDHPASGRTLTEFGPHDDGQTGPATAACTIEFVSLLRPDDFTIELMFDELFRSVDTIAPQTATTFALPRDPGGWTRFRELAISTAVRINWPAPIWELLAELKGALEAARHREQPGTLFYKADHSRLAAVFRNLDMVNRLSGELLSNLPKRLARIWLSLIDYAGPYPSNSSSHVQAQRHYLSFASLMLYQMLISALRGVLPGPSVSLPLTLESLSAPLWQHNISLCSGYEEETVVAYVSSIPGISVGEELRIYGPRSDSLRALEQSIMRQPITTPWFTSYLIPQVELVLARKAPNRETSYREQARIRKVTDLAGNDVS